MNVPLIQLLNATPSRSSGDASIMMTLTDVMSKGRRGGSGGSSSSGGRSSGSSEDIGCILGSIRSVIA